MSNEFVNLFELDGDPTEVKRFIDGHTTLTKFTNCQKVWDTHRFIQSHLSEGEREKVAESTGGRIKSKSANTLVLYNTSPIEECIRHIIKYYINITLKYSYYDEHKEIMYGWMYCKNGKIVDEDQIRLETPNPLIILNTIELNGNQNDIDIFLREHIRNESDWADKGPWDFSKYVSLIDNDCIKTWGTEKALSAIVESNTIILETINTPCYKWFLSIIEQFNFKINYKYVEKKHRSFYGYFISEGSCILTKDFITMNHNSLNKFKNLEDYLTFYNL